MINKSFGSLLLFLTIFVNYTFLTQKTASAQTASPLSCKVHTFLADSTTTLPFNYSAPELVNGSTVAVGDKVVYVFEITNNIGKERVVINKVTATHVRRVGEPIEIIDTRPLNGNCSVEPETKKITCDLNYSFGQSAHYPIEYLFRISDGPPNFPNTSTSFYIETDAGTASCASMLFIKNNVTVNPVKWETPYAKLQSSNFYIRVGDKKFYGKDPVSIHSDPGTERTTLEAIWKENDVEMRMFAYFRKIPDGMWELYDLRSYDGNTNGDWISYKDSLGNTVESLVGHRDYSYERKFIPSPPGIDAEIYCKDCEFNAFMSPRVTISPIGYSLEALIGLPAGEVVTLSTEPNTGYGVNVLLRDRQGDIVNDQSGFNYGWKVENPDIVDITAQTLQESVGSCAYGILPPCPLMHYYLQGKNPGETKVTISVLRQNDSVEVAKTSFNVRVKAFGSTSTIENKDLTRLKEQLEEVKKELEAQKSELNETQGVVQRIVTFIKRFFGKWFNN